MEKQSEYVSLSKMTKTQKIGVFFLSALGIGVIALWIWQFNNRVYSPFRINPDEKALSSSELFNTDNNQNNLEYLKYIDTDGDGISDYDEIHIHDTSPYLEDTDGDGINDYDEIFVHSSDPLCPEGQDCFASNIELPENDPMEILSPDSILNQVNEDNPLNLDQYQQDLNEVMTGEANPDTLRDLLKSTDLDPVVLENLSDEELMIIYQEMLLGIEE
jgi:hypothetical protein